MTRILKIWNVHSDPNNIENFQPTTKRNPKRKKEKKEDKILDSNTKQINMEQAQAKIEKEMPFVLIQLLYKQGMINKPTYQKIKEKYGNLPSCI